MTSGFSTPASHLPRQQASIPSMSGANPGIQPSTVASATSDGPTRRRPKSSGQPPTPATNPNEIYVVGYEARQWYHPDTTDKITLLNGTSIPIGVDAATEGKTGHLGTCTAQHLAEQMARSWLHSQLKSTDPTSQVAWKHKPWKKDAKGRWTYYIHSPSREIWLAVSITKCVVLVGYRLPTTQTRQNPSLGAIEQDGDVIDVFRITSIDTNTNRWTSVLRNRDWAVIRAGEVSVARGESVQYRYTITSVLDEVDFDAADVLVGLK